MSFNGADSAILPAAMPDEPLLREKAREGITSGRLPRQPANRTWGGPGTGGNCAVCAKPVPAAEMEFEVEIDQPGGARVAFRAHVRCFAAWEFERTKRTPRGSPADLRPTRGSRILRNV